MKRDEQQGFDLAGTTRRLEDWALEHVVFPVGEAVAQWPAGRSDAVCVVLMDHWTSHIERHGFRDGRRERAGSEIAERRALAVALALLEIGAFEVSVRERDELDWLRQAGGMTSIPAAQRAEMLALADQIAASPLSRALTTRRRGRPKLLLADAIAQQLRAGGFSYGAIAKFMGATHGAVRARCKTREVRSLANLFGPARTNTARGTGNPVRKVRCLPVRDARSTRAGRVTL